MFGNNVIVGQKPFKDRWDGALLVTSIFRTLQGEGPFAGCPAIFVRLTHCQLACSFCDTYFDHGDWFMVPELEHKLFETIHSGTERPSGGTDQKFGLVLTGGEPMLQKNIGPFLEHVQKLFKWTQIESNGLVLQQIPEDTVLVVSPKCAEKNTPAKHYLKPSDYTMARADCLKFVMSADPASPYSQIPSWALDWRELTGKEIFVSPMNIYNHEPAEARAIYTQRLTANLEDRSTKGEVISFWDPGLLDMEANRKNHEYASRYCLEHGLRFNVQLHLLAGLA